jgi:hypothetical protein
MVSETGRWDVVLVVLCLFRIFFNNLPFVFRYILFRQRGLDSTWRIIGVVVVGACFSLITNEAAKNENEMDCFQVVKM